MMLKLSRKNLEVWKYSLELIELIYRITRNFPKSELFGLIIQLRRASISVTSNISEGLSRTSKIEKCRFLEIARSSLVEIDAQIEISLRLKYISQEELPQIDKLINELFAMLTTLSNKIKSKN